MVSGMAYFYSGVPLINYNYDKSNQLHIFMTVAKTLSRIDANIDLKNINTKK
jgi:hypothetical protein